MFNLLLNQLGGAFSSTGAPDRGLVGSVLLKSIHHECGCAGQIQDLLARDLLLELRLFRGRSSPWTSMSSCFRTDVLVSELSSAPTADVTVSWEVSKGAMKEKRTCLA
ncbi:hypothetical protein D4764_10G0009690 [Takifugu flavidus]|uniref:Uncharacterized protein n=1 Tax=Takifugu flavidus TaxID=433684 RepID=A0A5C6PLY3_9TELE|nr:hypothetical protein D4764_10G0009690 [Takifugu flavidus]